jgi:hypothetical protein
LNDEGGASTGEGREEAREPEHAEHPREPRALAWSGSGGGDRGHPCPDLQWGRNRRAVIRS